MKRATLLIGIERDGDGVQLPDQVRSNGLAEVRTLAAREFGGYTLSNAAGGWINPQGVLVEEGAIRLDIYTDKPHADLFAFAREAGALFQQQSVVLDFEGEGELVEMDGSVVRFNAQTPEEVAA